MKNQPVHNLFDIKDSDTQEEFVEEQDNLNTETESRRAK